MIVFINSVRTFVTSVMWASVTEENLEKDFKIVNEDGILGNITYDKEKEEQDKKEIDWLATHTRDFSHELFKNISIICLMKNLKNNKWRWGKWVKIKD